VQDHLGMGQTEVEIHATAIPRPEGVTQRASGTGRARQNHISGTVQCQRECRVAGMISIADLIHAKV
jgi:hypothetical protein